ncbi:TIGR00282 family metallophosphoesterase [bacterium]|nr:TIGR00282 family metallophosphoesterase [bacterium]|tara:strand:- start:335 stop:1147 length:813 start_codon:yes stop_codon:yes gene_type:complete
MKILFIGDIVGQPGRTAVANILPALKRKEKFDLVIANAENASHGTGVSAKNIEELKKSGIDFFTSGNHIWKHGDADTILADKTSNLIRPANYSDELPGDGYRIIEVGSRKVAIINLMGRVFMGPTLDDPFTKLDQILTKIAAKKPNVILVDFHAEVTSEKVAFGWYADDKTKRPGQISAVLGTHTHVPTADTKILPSGTAYVTDTGMTGARDGVIGNSKDDIIQGFLDQRTRRKSIPESGPLVMNAVSLEIDPKNGRTKSITRMDMESEM